ncbi:MAG: hypothetical protein ACRDGF_06155, partial [Chloroflexota bacterium]
MPELVRAYPLALGQATPDLLCVSGVLLPAMQAALDASWQEASFVLMAANGPAYKVAAATGLCPVQQALPSRVRRAVQEVAGRMLRSQAQRCTIYGVLRQPDGALASAIADRQALSEAPLLLVRNVAECMGNAVRRGAALPP